MAHQAGLEDEGPGIPYPQDLHEDSPSGRVIRETMVFCLECYAGKDGAVALNTYPFERKLL
jgi:hypothetical protein